jgi:pimeloyl-ACP methyl ester carboxylesterase
MSGDFEVIAVTFGGHFGALHRPGPGVATRDVVIVICPTLGREGRSAYRALFCWSETLAAQGFSVLRYDALGEGDSAPVDPAADQCAAWLDGVVQAAAFMREQAGAPQLVLVGLRMGGALALAAAARAKADGMVLLAPLTTGAAWLRELRFSAAIQKLAPTEAGGLQVDGLHLSAATVRSLNTFDAASHAPSWRAAFLATPGADDRLAARLGGNVTATRFEGCNRLFMEPHLAETPTKVLGEANAWLAAFARAAAPAQPSAPLPSAQIEGTDWIETPVVVGDGLRGILCTPRGRAPGHAVVIGNTAADPRAGVGNFASRCSRALAGQGVAALRFDFSGVGESPGELGEAINIYAKSRVGEFLAAAELLNALGYQELSLVGVCTGGFHAVRAAIESKKFKRAVAFNAWLVFRPHRSLVLRSETADPKRRTSIRPEASGLVKVLRGEVNVVEALMRTARQIWTSLLPDARCLAMRRDLLHAGREGAEIHLVLGRGDVALRGLEGDFGPNCRWLRRRSGISVKVLPRLDHALFSTESQDNALAELFRILNLKASAAPSAEPQATDRLASMSNGQPADLPWSSRATT